MPCLTGRAMSIVYPAPVWATDPVLTGDWAPPPVTKR